MVNWHPLKTIWNPFEGAGRYFFQWIPKGNNMCYKTIVAPKSKTKKRAKLKPSCHHLLWWIKTTTWRTHNSTYPWGLVSLRVWWVELTDVDPFFWVRYSWKRLHKASNIGWYDINHDVLKVRKIHEFKKHQQTHPHFCVVCFLHFSLCLETVHFFWHLGSFAMETLVHK